MIAALTLAPSRRLLLPSLQLLADAMVLRNEQWLREQLDLGMSPPRTLASAAAPWAARGVRYRPSHGSPVDTTRIYQDGPTAMHSGWATCFDVATYDAPASTVLLGRPLGVRILPIGNALPGQPLRCHAWLVPLGGGDLIDPLASFA